MSYFTIADLIANALAALFGLSGLLHVIAPLGLRHAYGRWGFARGFHYVAGGTQLLASLFLAVHQTRIWGGFLAAAILFVAVTSLLNRRKYLYAVPAVLVMAIIVPAMAGAI
jgi:hypothetical protein